MKESGISFAKRGKHAKGQTASAYDQARIKHGPDPVTPCQAAPEAKHSEASGMTGLLTPHTPGGINIGGINTGGIDFSDTPFNLLEGAYNYGDWGVQDAFSGGIDDGFFAQLSDEDGVAATKEKEEEGNGDDDAFRTASPREWDEQVERPSRFSQQGPSPRTGLDREFPPKQGPASSACDVFTSSTNHKELSAMALSPSRTFFRIHEMLAADQTDNKSGDDDDDNIADDRNMSQFSPFELFARITRSTRENFSKKQYFLFQDLLSPSNTVTTASITIPGILKGWDTGSPMDCAARRFLEPPPGPVGRKCYCVGEMRASEGGGRMVLVKEVRPVLWGDVMEAQDVLGRDDLDWVCDGGL